MTVRTFPPLTRSVIEDIRRFLSAHKSAIEAFNLAHVADARFVA